MIRINHAAIVAAGIEMSKAGLAVNNDDLTMILWIKWHWSMDGKETFAPYTGISFERQPASTHVIEGKFYCEFPPNMFTKFLSTFVKVEELNKES